MGEEVREERKSQEERSTSYGYGPQWCGVFAQLASSSNCFLKGYKRLAVDNKTAPYHVRNAAAQTSQHAIAVPISAPQKLTMMVTPMKRYVEEKSIHPSWEAKRKLKEKDSARIVPSQGTKIKF